MKPLPPRRRLTFAEWQEEGQMLRRRRETNSWALGDWLVAGDVLAFDPGFVESRRITGYSRSYVYALKYASEWYAPADRNPNVSWAVHRGLMQCGLKRDTLEFRELFDRAVKEHWSLHDVSRYNRETKGKAEPHATAPRSYENRCVKCPECAAVFPVKGNKVDYDGPGRWPKEVRKSA